VAGANKENVVVAEPNEANKSKGGKSKGGKSKVGKSATEPNQSKEAIEPVAERLTVRKKKHAQAQLASKMNQVREARMTSPGYQAPAKVGKEEIVKLTDQEAAAWRKKGKEFLALENRTRDLCTLWRMVALGCNNPFLYQCAMFLLSPTLVNVKLHELMVGSYTTWNTFTLETLRHGSRNKQWTIPQLGQMPSHVVEMLEHNCYKKLKEEWNERKKEIVDANYTYQGVRIADLPDCPSWEVYKNMVDDGRKIMWILMWSHKEFFDRATDGVMDRINKEVVTLMMEVLQPLNRATHFRKKIEEIKNEGIAHHKAVYERKRERFPEGFLLGKSVAEVADAPTPDEEATGQLDTTATFAEDGEPDKETIGGTEEATVQEEASKPTANVEEEIGEIGGTEEATVEEGAGEPAANVDATIAEDGTAEDATAEDATASSTVADDAVDETGYSGSSNWTSGDAVDNEEKPDFFYDDDDATMADDESTPAEGATSAEERVIDDLTAADDVSSPAEGATTAEEATTDAADEAPTPAEGATTAEEADRENNIRRGKRKPPGPENRADTRELIRIEDAKKQKTIIYKTTQVIVTNNNNVNNVSNVSNVSYVNPTTSNALVVAKVEDFHNNDYMQVWPKRENSNSEIDFGKVDFSHFDFRSADMKKLPISPMLKMRDDTMELPEAIFAYPKIAREIARTWQANIDAKDPNLGMFIRRWQEHLMRSPHITPGVAFRRYCIALRGANRSSLEELWLGYFPSVDQKGLAAPKRSGPRSHLYRKPDEAFVIMANDAMQVMKVLLEGCYLNGLQIIRYYWEYHLMKGLKQLSLEELDSQKRLRGMLACLILSAATTDFEAIKGAIRLGKAKLLDTLDALISARLPVIEKCIKGCGIHKTRARYLKDAFKKIKKDFGGLVPNTFVGLMSLPGVGRKTASLMLNEGFGFYAGIGTDKHVCHVALGLGLFVPTHGLKNAPPEHVENSLRTWIRQHDFKDTNKIFGGTAQLVTQKLAKLTSGGARHEKNLLILMNVMMTRFSDDREIEILLFLFAQLRAHYKVVAERREILKARDSEESDEECEVDLEEAEKWIGAMVLYDDQQEVQEDATQQSDDEDGM
jgi:endonuclease III